MKKTNELIEEVENETKFEVDKYWETEELEKLNQKLNGRDIIIINLSLFQKLKNT